MVFREIIARENSVSKTRGLVLKHTTTLNGDLEGVVEAYFKFETEENYEYSL